MARVTDSEVLELMGNPEIESGIGIYIEVAHNLVNRVFEGDLNILQSTLKELELFITAHIITSTVLRQAVKEQVGDASVEYNKLTGDGLQSTSYGNVALMIDYTGKLRSMVSKKQISIISLCGNR
jgi:hypothetical protein